MGVPRWVSRPCWAFILTIVLLVFLLVAIILPWYSWVIDVNETLPSNSSMNVDGDIAVLWVWKGIYVQIRADDGSSLSHLDINQHSISWSEMEHKEHVQSIYMASMAFAIITFIVALVLAACILFCLVITRSRELCQRVFCNRAKWYVFGLCVLTLLLSFISWTVFFGFPGALKKDHLCPNGNFFTDFSDDLWCSESDIVGVAKYTAAHLALAWQPDFEPVAVNCRVAWSPSIGWLFALISSILLLPISFLILISKDLTMHERAYSYERIHMKNLEY